MSEDRSLIMLVRREVERVGECVDIRPEIARLAWRHGYSLRAAEDATIGHWLDLVRSGGPLDVDDLVRVTVLLILADARGSSTRGVAS